MLPNRKPPDRLTPRCGSTIDFLVRDALHAACQMRLAPWRTPSGDDHSREHLADCQPSYVGNGNTVRYGSILLDATFRNEHWTRRQIEITWDCPPGWYPEGGHRGLVSPWQGERVCLPLAHLLPMNSSLRRPNIAILRGFSGLEESSARTVFRALAKAR